MGALITKEYNGLSFTFREDGYFNMTKAAGESLVVTKLIDWVVTCWTLLLPSAT